VAPVGASDQTCQHETASSRQVEVPTEVEASAVWYSGVLLLRAPGKVCGAHMTGMTCMVMHLSASRWQSTSNCTACWLLWRHNSNCTCHCSLLV
jgi:hypothetical protein